jgi:hypothetical protein
MSNSKFLSPYFIAANIATFGPPLDAAFMAAVGAANKSSIIATYYAASRATFNCINREGCVALTIDRTICTSPIKAEGPT